MDFDNNKAIYLQIIELIKTDLINSKIKLGDKLPSTRELANELKVNPNTISRVYKELENDNITFTKRGMGTYITEDENILKSIKSEMARDILNSFVEGMTNLGFSKKDMIDMLSNLKEGENVIRK